MDYETHHDGYQSLGTSFNSGKDSFFFSIRLRISFKSHYGLRIH